MGLGGSSGGSRGRLQQLFKAVALDLITTVACKSIVVNSRPAGMRTTAFTQERPPRPPNVQFSRDLPDQRRKRVTGVFSKHTTTLSALYPRTTGSNRRIIDLPNYSRG